MAIGMVVSGVDVWKADYETDGHLGKWKEIEDYVGEEEIERESYDWMNVTCDLWDGLFVALAAMATCS